MKEDGARKRPSAGRRGGPRRGALLRFLPLAAALLFLITGLARFDPDLTLSGDNAQFLILGQSIAEGRGMVQINEPHPTPHTKYPFFFPLILAVLHLVSPGSILLPKAAVLLFGAGALFHLARILVRIAPPGVSVPAVVLTAVNPILVEFSSQVLSEIPYLYFSCLAVDLFQLWEGKIERNRSGAVLCLTGALAAALAAFFTRSVGITLVVALLFSLARKRELRIAVLFLVIFLVTAGGWSVRNRSVGEGDSYLTQFVRINPYRPELGNMTIARFFTGRIPANVAHYGGHEVGRGMVPHLYLFLRPGETGWKTMVSVVAALGALAGLFLRLRSKIGIVEIYALIYMVPLLAWPEVWAGIRFLIPLIPFFILFLLEAGSKLAAPAGRRAGLVAVGALALVLLSSSVEANRREIALPRGYPPAWANYFAVADWVGKETPEESIVVCRKPYLFYIRSGRRTVPYLWSKDRRKVIEKMVSDGADFVVIAPLFSSTGRYLIPAVTEYQDRFEVILNLKDPETYLLRLTGEERP